MKGIVLAGGKGTRLFPMTLAISKHLLPIYDKPLIYYPISILLMACIKDILIVSTPEDQDSYKRLLGDGSHLGIKFSYVAQKEPNGLPEAFILGEAFLNGDAVTLILGDNIFYGDRFVNDYLKPAIASKIPTAFAYRVNNPERYGVIEFDKEFNVISIKEKPKHPKSDYAITGLYVFDNKAVEYSKRLKPSKRGELEILDIIESYKVNNCLKVQVLGRGIAWLDTGTCESMLDASNFIEAIEKRQGLKIACLEEIAYQEGYISLNSVYKLALQYKGASYGNYLMKLIEGKNLEFHNPL